jgi:hypothetical protein
MSKDMRKKKLEFFKVGSMALSAMSDYQDVYACPICQFLFDVSAVDSGALTLEDSPLRSLGGRPIALTCNVCNSTAGHTIDAALKQREDFVGLTLGLFGHGESFGGNARLSAEGVTTNIRLRGEGKYVRFEVPEKQNHPDVFQAQRGVQPPKEEVEEGDPREFKIHAPVRFDWRHAGIGDLKSAYIAAFAKYGFQPACWYQARGPRRGPEILGMEKPFRGLLIPLGRAIVGLPWGGDPKIFYVQLRELLSGGPERVGALQWPDRPRSPRSSSGRFDWIGTNPHTHEHRTSCDSALEALDRPDHFTPGGFCESLANAHQ